MSNQTYATWANATSLAGVSDARQVRQVMTGLNLINYDKLPFCQLLGGQEAFEKDGNFYTREVAGKIRSKGVRGLKPELYDFEVAPNAFRLTADTAAVNNGDTVTVTLNTTAGLQAGDTINKADQRIMLRVISVTNTTQASVKVIAGATGAILSSDANVARMIKLGSATADGSTIGNGVNQEPINRYNYLQFHLKPVTVGMIQKQLQTYGSSGNNFADMKRIAGYDFQRERESTFIFGTRATEGTAGGTDYITYAGGLLDLSGSVYDNDSPDGTLTEDVFNRGLMPMMRQGGGSAEVYALCGTDVMVTLSGFSRTKIQTNSGDQKYSSNIRTLETPSGILHLVPHAMLDQEAYKGVMIGFQPELLTRCYLEGMDSQFAENLNVGNVLKDISAYMAVEGLIAQNPKAITIATGILK